MFTSSIKSNQDIHDLITCNKIFKSAPKRESIVNKNISRKFSVYSQNDNLEFDIFITSSVRMEQDFSLGLLYDNMLLYRCNGFHGTTRAGYYSFSHHAYPHAHILSISDIQSGRAKAPSNIENLTGKYINLNTATLYFFNKCGIIGYEKYFNINQLTFEEFLQ